MSTSTEVVEELVEPEGPAFLWSHRETGRRCRGGIETYSVYDDIGQEIGTDQRSCMKPGIVDYAGFCSIDHREDYFSSVGAGDTRNTKKGTHEWYSIGGCTAQSTSCP